MSLKSFLNTKRVGLVLRTYATKPEDVAKRVEAIKGFVETALPLMEYIRQVNVVVWADGRFSDADCGQTAEALRREFSMYTSWCYVSEYSAGDLYCGILNYMVARQLRDRIDYTLVASTEAESYFNVETVAAMFEAVDSGAKASGIAINELAESVLQGRLANTMCLWDNIALMSVGGFDLRAAKPIGDKLVHHLKGWSREKGEEVYYPLAGVEEVIPLARLVETYGPCIAPILPKGEGVQRYQVPDAATQSELWKRHVAKMGTKQVRQATLLASAGYDLSYLEGGVMPAYRQK